MACVDIVKHPREDDITRLATDSYIWGGGRERERRREREEGAHSTAWPRAS